MTGVGWSRAHFDIGSLTALSLQLLPVLFFEVI
jgi:hypothetical protein